MKSIIYQNTGVLSSIYDLTESPCDEYLNFIFYLSRELSCTHILDGSHSRINESSPGTVLHYTESTSSYKVRCSNMMDLNDFTLGFIFTKGLNSFKFYSQLASLKSVILFDSSDLEDILEERSLAQKHKIAAVIVKDEDRIECLLNLGLPVCYLPPTINKSIPVVKSKKIFEFLTEDLDLEDSLNLNSFSHKYLPIDFQIALARSCKYVRVNNYFNRYLAYYSSSYDYVKSDDLIESTLFSDLYLLTSKSNSLAKKDFILNKYYPLVKSIISRVYEIKTSYEKLSSSYFRV